MFSWSKDIMKKITDANCLTDRELSLVEIALRLQDCHQGLLNECLGIDNGQKFFDMQHTNLPSSRYEKCPTCNGLGIDKRSTSGKCKTCYGTGSVLVVSAKKI